MNSFYVLFLFRVAKIVKYQHSFCQPPDCKNQIEDKKAGTRVQRDLLNMLRFYELKAYFISKIL